MAQIKTKHYAVTLCLALSFFVGSLNAECCTDGETEIDPDDCTKYRVCCHGEFVSKSCEDGMYWNSDTGKCEINNGECNPTNCVEGEIEGNPEDCAAYLECINGTVVSQSCADGYYFNVTECIPDTCGVCEDNGECNGTPSCTEGELEIDPADCAGYLACSNGTLVNKKCPNDTYFNNNTLTCTPDLDGVCLNCTEGSQRPEPSGDCTKYQICSGGRYVTVSCDTGDYWNSALGKCVKDNGECNGTPSCTDGELEIDPADCAGYLACSNGTLVNKKCPNDTYFNNNTLTCTPDLDGVCLNCIEGSQRPEPSGDCTKYQICSGGRYVTVSCDAGDYWNSTLGKCVKDNGECNGTPSCTDGELEIDPADCAGYLACSNGTLVNKKCPNDTYFNNNTLTCTPDLDGVCLNCTEGSQRPEPSGDCTKYQICSGGKYVTVSCDAGDYWNSTLGECVKDNGECNGTPSCTDGELEIDPADCAGYLACSNGTLVNKKCPNDNYFNNNTLTCTPDLDGVCLNCTEGSKKPEPSGDCTKYQICAGGKYVTMSCSAGEYWNNNTKICEMDNGECNGTPSCQEGDIKENPADCAGYMQCVNGNYVARKCSATEFFNTTLNQCVVDQDGVCIPKTCDPQCCDLPNYSMWPVEKNCSAFFQCVGGKYAEQTCPNNLQFNTKTESCDYPENVDCDDGSAPPSGPNAGPSGTYCESHGRCVGRSDGTMLPYEINACSSSYIVCQCECEVNFICSDGLIFNVDLQTCDWASNVKC
ncbi:tenascin [Drosophila serrata]|uniref:tenascin n=1 Tax=Drosophila serrata TaxID=7274 RepID=UPI000A1D398D|nr:tenascin [Drosophila serrata]